MEDLTCWQCDKLMSKPEDLDDEGVCWTCIEEDAIEDYATELDETLLRVEMEFFLKEDHTSDADRLQAAKTMLRQYLEQAKQNKKRKGRY